MMIDEREYARLLGYPWGTLLKDDVRERAVQASAWYREHGKPRVYCVTLEDKTVAAITAGVEVEVAVAELWRADRVDEAYFLDRYAAAVVERLAAGLGPYDSPGTGGRNFDEQFILFEHIARLKPQIEILPSGMLKPKNSLLAVVSFDGRRAPNPCTRCDLAGCTFRRTAA
jgi:hypothetical protein